MIIVSDKENSGLNGFYSILFSENKYIYGLNWNKYRKFVELFVAIDMAFLLFFAWLSQEVSRSEKFFEISFPLFYMYFFTRLKICQPRVKILATSNVKRKVAPIIVWLDYISIGMAGVTLQRVIMNTTSEDIYHYWGIFLQINFFLYAMMPFITYLNFRLKKR